MPDETEEIAGANVDSFSIDDAGRVIVTDPQLAEMLRREVAARNRGTNTNCGCNNVPGCGASQNLNVVKGCAEVK